MPRDNRQPLARMLDRAFSVFGAKPELSVKISGDNAALNALRQLPDEVQKRVLRQALRKSQGPGYGAAWDAAQAIRTKRTIDGRPHLVDTLFAKIKDRGDYLAGSIGYTGPAGWLVEHGHRLVRGGTVARINSRRTDYGRSDKVWRQGPDGKKQIDQARTGRGEVIGQVPAHPFLGPAMDKAAEEMERIFIDEVERGTDRAVKRLAKLAGPRT